MAKTVDELVVKITAEGTAQITEATKAMDNLSAANGKTGEALKGSQFQIRNVAFQVQDMAVQIAGGTSAFVAMGQQIPQLLGGFGAMGAVIGAVAAIGIPLLRLGLSAAGVDLRNFDERTKVLTESIKNYQTAQTANLPTLQGLGTGYGVLTGEAKAFFDVQQKLTEQKVNSDLSAALKQLKKDYSSFTDEAKKAAEAQVRIGAADPSTLLFIGNTIRAWNLGLTAEQAKHVGEALKDINKATPEEAAKTLNEILEYLKISGVEAGKFKKFFDETVEPILKINNQIIEMKKNMTESAKQASDLNAELLGIQNSFQPDVNAARRNFDLVGAARKEGEMKIAEFRRQLQEKTDKDQVDRSKEIAAFELRTNQDVSDKIKDVGKSQSEAYKTSILTNDGKRRQLSLEEQILAIQDKGRYDAAYNLKYDEEIARNAKDYADTLVSIAEQRRKNLITADGEKKLILDAADIEQKANDNAAKARAKAVKDFVLTQQTENMKKAIEEQIAAAQKLGDALRTINDKGVDVKFATGLKGKSPLEQQVLQIREDSRKAALEAGRAFSDMFASEDGLTPEKAQQLSDGLDAIAIGYKKVADAQVGALGVSKDFADSNMNAIKGIQEQIKGGLTQAWDDYKTKATDTSGQIKESFSTFTTGMEDAFVKFAQGGKLSFSDLANSIIADLARIAVRKSIVGLAAMFGFAAGGSVMADTPIIVGERGPEIFVPQGAGTIIPNNQIGNGGSGQAPVTVNYNIQAVDASSFRALVAKDPSFIYAVTEQGRRSQPTRRAM